MFSLLKACTIPDNALMHQYVVWFEQIIAIKFKLFKVVLPRRVIKTRMAVAWKWNYAHYSGIVDSVLKHERDCGMLQNTPANILSCLWNVLDMISAVISTKCLSEAIRTEFPFFFLSFFPQCHSGIRTCVWNLISKYSTQLPCYLTLLRGVMCIG